jgi:hypothetical protein
MFNAAARAFVSTASRALVAAATMLAARQVLGVQKPVGSGSIADDAVGTIALGGAVTGGMVTIYTNAAASGQATFHFRASSSPFCVVVNQTGVVWAGSTAALTGTTGVDGQITVSVDTLGNITVENRSGAARAFFATVQQMTRD